MIAVDMTMLKNESLDRANADLEIVVSAYPDECRSLTNSLETKACFSDTFPLTWEIRLPDETTRLNTITLQMIDGYPIESNVQVVSYRSNEKARIEAVVQRIRETAMECQQEGIEGALSCVSAALETWEEFTSNARHETAASVNLKNTLEEADVVGETTQRKLKYTWISSETPLIDRKSSFVAHICRQATSELEVHEALQQLLTSTSKIQRATHNMVSAQRASEGVNDR